MATIETNDIVNGGKASEYIHNNRSPNDVSDWTSTPSLEIDEYAAFVKIDIKPETIVINNQDVKIVKFFITPLNEMKDCRSKNVSI